MFDRRAGRHARRLRLSAQRRGLLHRASRTATSRCWPCPSRRRAAAWAPRSWRLRALGARARLGSADAARDGRTNTPRAGALRTARLRRRAASLRQTAADAEVASRSRRKMRACTASGRCVALLAVVGGRRALQRQHGPPAAPSFDVLIRNGHVLDGTGNPWIRADVGITGDRIAAVGRLGGATAATMIDAAAGTCPPGFIDVHSHAGPGLATDDAEARPAGARAGHHHRARQPRRRRPDRSRGRSAPPTRAGHRPQRRPVRAARLDAPQVLGMSDRDPDCRASSRKMVDLVREGMRAGAFGLSSGLYYAPGQLLEDRRGRRDGAGPRRRSAAATPATSATKADYGVGVVAAVDEVITIAEQAGLDRRRHAHEGARARPAGACRRRWSSTSRRRARAACRCSPISIPTRPAAPASSAR